MVHYNEPYVIVTAHLEHLVYTLNLSPTSNIFSTFYTSLLHPFIFNDDNLYSMHAHAEPGPVVTSDGQLKHVVEKIIDHRRCGYGFQYLVRHDQWMCRVDVENLAALDLFLQENGLEL